MFPPLSQSSATITHVPWRRNIKYKSTNSAIKLCTAHVWKELLLASVVSTRSQDVSHSRSWPSATVETQDTNLPQMSTLFSKLD